MTKRERLSLRNAFTFFRSVWSPRASYHLARIRFSHNWQDRLVSAFWLASQRIPLTGADPSLNFRGLPHNAGAGAAPS